MYVFVCVFLGGSTPSHTFSRIPFPAPLCTTGFADYSVEVSINGEAFEVIVDSGSSTFAVAASPTVGCSRFYSGSCNGHITSNVYGDGTG